jgi:thiamine pyrophosphate-dependent acetolactate synthase large subunit-like protein
MDPALSLQRWPEFAAVAEAMGATGVTVRNLDDLGNAAAAIRDRKGPVLLDAKLDPQMISEVTAMVH